MSNLLLSAEDMQKATANMNEGQKARLFDNLLTFAVSNGTKEPKETQDLEDLKAVAEFCDLTDQQTKNDNTKDLKRQIVNAVKRRFV